MTRGATATAAAPRLHADLCEMAPVDRDIDLCNFGRAMATSPSAAETRRDAGPEERPAESQAPLFPELVGAAPESPAGPIDAELAAALAAPPNIDLPKVAQTLRFSMRQIEFVFKARRELGEVFRMHGVIPGGPVITSHPDHVKSLFMAKPEQAPSLTGESPLRPILGPNSVLTAVGPRHMRQRKLLLPPFHGEAIAQYVEMITEAAEREIDSWPVGETIALAPRMQAITLDVIMAGIFGIEGKPAPGTPEAALRTAIRKTVAASTWPTSQLTELMHVGREEPMGPLKFGLGDARPADLRGDPRARGAAADLEERRDILSLLLQARTEEGEALDRQRTPRRAPHPGARRPRDDRQLARLGWERLVRNPEPHAAPCSTRSAATTAPRSGSRRRSSRRCATAR